MDPVSDEAVAGASLAPLLHDSMVDWEVLRHDYGPLLGLVETLLGVVPNCDQYLEIWPPAFRSYNLMVPNLLNLPVPIFGLGGPPPGTVGLAMYVASRTAECPYCSAHTCSFALRRGADPATVAVALMPERAASLSPGELAAIALSRSLSRIPCELTAAEKAELVAAYGERGAEWIALGAVMMGFLNKFMDAIGVELEPVVVAEVTETMGADWSPGKAGAGLNPTMPGRPAPPADGLRTKLRVVPLLPAAIRLDRRWQQGTPSRWPAVGAFLAERTGHDFPVLGRLRSNRARRAMASMLRENLDPATTKVGMDVKVLAGAIFAEVVADRQLAEDVRALAPRAAVDPGRLDAAVGFAAQRRSAPPADDRQAATALTLARAASPSPARIDADIVSQCRDSGLPPAAIVEVVTWLAVLQMLHRLTGYVDPAA
jgi:alkylhydroperoxidase family enzyme